MDHSRFDALTRHLGSAWRARPTRRGFLVAALGAALVLDDAAGGKGRRRKRCRKAGQTCVSHGRALGKCCKYSSCQDVLYDQRKFCLCKPGYWDPNRTGHCSPVECRALGEVCQSAGECCQDTISGAACAPVNDNKGPRGCGFLTLPGSPNRCCLGENAICSGDCECCGALTCQDGRCRTPAAACRSLREMCTEQAECCGGESNRIACEFIDPFKANGSCGPISSSNRCCTTPGWECHDSCECCGSMACINGTCSYSVPGQECQETAQCLGGTCETVQPKPDGSCLIPANQPPPQLCCFHEDHECFDSCECCGTLTCQDRVCSSFLSG